MKILEQAPGVWKSLRKKAQRWLGMRPLVAAVRRYLERRKAGCHDYMHAAVWCATESGKVN